MTVEQVDRDAAAKVLRTFIQDPAYADAVERGKADYDPNVRLFEAHREQERAAIVAWLHTHKAGAAPIRIVRAVEISASQELLVRAIEAGEHLDSAP